MTTKYDVLNTMNDIFHMESGVTWGSYTEHGGTRPNLQWEAVGGEMTVPWAKFNTSIESHALRIDSFFIVMSTDTTFVVNRGKIPRINPYNMFDSEFMREFLVDPLQKYIEFHDHELCLEAMVARMHRSEEEPVLTTVVGS